MRLAESRTNSALAGGLAWRGISAWPAKAVERMGIWHQRMVERRQLAGLTATELKDIGISRADVAGEVAKPFWRP